jgi:hypothetical protein
MSVRQFVADFRRSDSYKSPSWSILRRVRLLVARMSRVVDLVEMGKFSGWFDQHGAHFYISMKDCAKLGSLLGSHKLSNIYVSSSEVVWEWIVVPLQSNGQQTRCAKQDHCLIQHYQIR